MAPVGHVEHGEDGGEQDAGDDVDPLGLVHRLREGQAATDDAPGVGVVVGPLRAEGEAAGAAHGRWPGGGWVGRGGGYAAGGVKVGLKKVQV